MQPEAQVLGRWRTQWRDGGRTPKKSRAEEAQAIFKVRTVEDLPGGLKGRAREMGGMDGFLSKTFPLYGVKRDLQMGSSDGHRTS